LNNDVALSVTGGAGGLGFEAARAILEHGVAKIALFDINPTAGHEAVARLKATFPETDVHFKLVNVTDPEIVNAAVDQVAVEFGQVDILLAFAGIVGCCHAEEITPEAWHRILDVNLTGSWLCAQAVGK
jgi:sorbose reductase